MKKIAIAVIALIALDTRAQTAKSYPSDLPKMKIEQSIKYLPETQRTRIETGIRNATFHDAADAQKLIDLCHFLYHMAQQKAEMDDTSAVTAYNAINARKKPVDVETDEENAVTCIVAADDALIALKNDDKALERVFHLSASDVQGISMFFDHVLTSRGYDLVPFVSKDDRWVHLGFTKNAHVQK